MSSRKISQNGAPAKSYSTKNTKPNSNRQVPVTYQYQPNCQQKQMEYNSMKYLLCMGWRNFVPVVVLCQFLVLAENRFWFYILMYLEYNTVVVLC